MNRLPARYLPHGGKVAYEPKLGEGTYGPRFGPRVTPERAALDEKQRRIRTADGRDIMSLARIALDLEHQMPVGSRVILRPGTPLETVATVAVIAIAEWPRLPKFIELSLE